MKPGVVTQDRPGFWRYYVPANRSAKMCLLTLGRTMVQGPWTGELGEHYVAWSPMPKRDKDLEDQLIAEGKINP